MRLFRKQTIRFLAALGAAGALAACTISELDVEAVGGDPMFIVDRDSKIWDISYAVETYGMDPDRFQYGLGKNAILPITDPRFIGPGHPDYPDRDETFLVIGTQIEGTTRAYRKRDIVRHEVVVERFGDAHVAVTY